MSKWINLAAPFGSTFFLGVACVIHIPLCTYSNKHNLITDKVYDTLCMYVHNIFLSSPPPKNAYFVSYCFLLFPVLVSLCHSQMRSCSALRKR